MGVVALEDRSSPFFISFFPFFSFPPFLSLLILFPLLSPRLEIGAVRSSFFFLFSLWSAPFSVTGISGYEREGRRSKGPLFFSSLSFFFFPSTGSWRQTALPFPAFLRVIGTLRQLKDMPAGSPLLFFFFLSSPASAGDTRLLEDGRGPSRSLS